MVMIHKRAKGQRQRSLDSKVIAETDKRVKILWPPWNSSISLLTCIEMWALGKIEHLMEDERAPIYFNLKDVGRLVSDDPHDWWTGQRPVVTYEVKRQDKNTCWA